MYLKYLLDRVKKAGVAVKRGSLSHIMEATNINGNSRRADIVINCTGLGAASLGGVADSQVYPARGQVCLVKNTCRGVVATSGTDDGRFETFYTQPRLNGTRNMVCF